MRRVSATTEELIVAEVVVVEVLIGDCGDLDEIYLKGQRN